MPRFIGRGASSKGRWKASPEPQRAGLPQGTNFRLPKLDEVGLPSGGPFSFWASQGEALAGVAARAGSSGAGAAKGPARASLRLGGLYGLGCIDCRK